MAEIVSATIRSAVNRNRGSDGSPTLSSARYEHRCARSLRRDGGRCCRAQQRTNDFASIKTSPREAAAARSAQTQSLPQLIANVRSIFRNEIDKMMTAYRKSNPDFYNGYFAARAIVNRAATHAAPKAAPPGPTPPPP